MDQGDRLPLHPVRILEVTLGVVAYVRFLGPISGLPLHYSKGHYVACEGDADCNPTLHKQRPVFKYYGPSEVWINSQARWRPAVFEATEHMEEQLHGRELRGEVWLVTREGESKKTATMIGTFVERLSDEKVSPAFDIEPVLIRYYRVNKLLLGMPSPLPRKLFLSDVSGAPPKLPRDMEGPTEEELQAEREKVKETLAKMRERIGNGFLGGKK